MFVKGPPALTDQLTLERLPTLMDASGGACGVLHQFGVFPYSGNLSVAHASELDITGRRLFTTVSPTAHSYGMAVVNVASSVKGDRLENVIPFGSARKSQLWSPTWVEADAGKGRLWGVATDDEGSLFWRSLDPASGDSGRHHHPISRLPIGRRGDRGD